MQTLCRLMYRIITDASLCLRLVGGVPSTVDWTNALSVQFQCSTWASLLAALAGLGVAPAMLAFASRGNDTQRHVGVVVEQSSSGDSGFRP